MAATSRLFFALWPSETERQAVEQCQQQVQQRAKTLRGRPVSPENLHITLVFLGELNTQQQRCVSQAASQVVAEPFSLQLNTLGYWQKPHILWLAPQTMPMPLLKLVGELNRHLRVNCQHIPERRPYQAHITLMRKATIPPVSLSSFSIQITWTVEAFCLVRSKTSTDGAHYEVIERWPL